MFSAPTICRPASRATSFILPSFTVGGYEKLYDSAQSTLSASPSPLRMRSIRSGIERRIAASKQRTVPIKVALSGITLNVVPASNFPTVTTSGSFGAISRLTIVCSILTTYAPATAGSIARVRVCLRDLGFLQSRVIGQGSPDACDLLLHVPRGDVDVG